MTTPKLGQHYRHYKSTGGSDHTYEIIGIAKHTETEEVLVIYKPLYDNKTRFGGTDFAARPLSMRNEEVEREGKKQKRFTLI